jgi:hypothetical protein
MFPAEIIPRYEQQLHGRKMLEALAVAIGQTGGDDLRFEKINPIHPAIMPEPNQREKWGE